MLHLGEVMQHPEHPYLLQLGYDDMYQEAADVQAYIESKGGGFIPLYCNFGVRGHNACITAYCSGRGPEQCVCVAELLRHCYCQLCLYTLIMAVIEFLTSFH